MPRETVAGYIAHIRTPTKREYAKRYARYLRHGGKDPTDPADLSYMAAQAVRMRLHELIHPARETEPEWEETEIGSQMAVFPETRIRAPEHAAPPAPGRQMGLFRRPLPSRAGFRLLRERSRAARRRGVR